MTADALFELGVPILNGDDEPLPCAECIRIARRLRTPGYAPVGLPQRPPHGRYRTCAGRVRRSE